MKPDRPTIPAAIELVPIDATALDGRYRLIFGGEYFAVARAIDGAWCYSSGMPVDITPTHYHAGQRRG